MRNDDFERLYGEHAKPLLNFLAYRTGDRALAEDILADTFERVLRGRRRFDPRRASEKTWLYTIALNLLRDHARRADAGRRALEQVQVASPPGRAMGDLDAADERDVVHRALAVLSEAERETVALRYGADLTVAEIATLTREKSSTVHGRLYRSLRKLRDELD